MSLNLLAFLVGLLGVPVALLILGHKLRRRSLLARRVFFGGVLGHIVGACIAIAVGIFPAEIWHAGQPIRGFFGLWSLLLLPAVGAGLTVVSSRFRTLLPDAARSRQRMTR